MPTILKKPIVRRIPGRKLVIRLTRDGVELRGFRRRKSKFVTWEQIASLANEDETILFAAEQNEGRRALAAIETRNGKEIA